MGECLILRSGGMDTSDATAKAEHILVGYTGYVNDALITGTIVDNGVINQSLNCGGSYTIPVGYHNGSGKVTANALSGQTSATAAAGDVLKDKTAWVGGSKLTGTMTNNGTVNQSLNPGGSYTVPVGYHNGSGKVSVTALSANTLGTATAAYILSGYTAWVGGSKLTGTMANRGAVSQALAANGSYTIPAGYHNGSGKVSQSLTTQAAATITPGTANKTAVAAGRWTTGAVICAGASTLVAGNIKKGVTIFGVVGTWQGWVDSTIYAIRNGVIQSGISWKWGWNNANYKTAPVKNGDYLQVEAYTSLYLYLPSSNGYDLNNFLGRCHLDYRMESSYTTTANTSTWISPMVDLTSFSSGSYNSSLRYAYPSSDNRSLVTGDYVETKGTINVTNATFTKYVNTNDITWTGWVGVRYSFSGSGSDFGVTFKIKNLWFSP